MREFLDTPWGPVILWLVIMLPFWIALWWWQRRDRRRAAAAQRQWAAQQQVWEIEQAIREEQLSDQERAWQRH